MNYLVDDLLPDARALLAELGYLGSAPLQRKLRISYNRAHAVLGKLRDLGEISEPTGGDNYCRPVVKVEEAKP
jgi:hypothetical protein